MDDSNRRVEPKTRSPLRSGLHRQARISGPFVTSPLSGEDEGADAVKHEKLNREQGRPTRQELREHRQGFGIEVLTPMLGDEPAEVKPCRRPDIRELSLGIEGTTVFDDCSFEVVETIQALGLLEAPLCQLHLDRELLEHLVKKLDRRSREHGVVLLLKVARLDPEILGLGP